MLNRDATWVSAEKLCGVRDRPGSVLGSSNFQIVAMDSNLLKSKCLSCVFSCIKVYECIVAISTDPNSNYWHVLEETHIFPHLLQSTIEKFHKFYITQVQWDISDI